MISRGNMGKQLTGNRTKKMAAGGKASQSKSSGSESAGNRSAPAAGKPKAGTSAAGKTVSTSSVRGNPNSGGGGGLLGGIRNIGKNFAASLKPSPTVTDPKTGQTFDRPNYRGLSVKGLTSTDPANVARNREAAARYAAMEAARPVRSDAEERRSLERRQRVEDRLKGTQPQTPSAPGGPIPPTVPTTTTGGMTMPPPGYRPGIDPEWNYRPPQTVVMKKGGKVKPKGKK